MTGRQAARRRQLADLYKAGKDDPLLRRRCPRTRPRTTSCSNVDGEREAIHREREKELHRSVAETLQHGQRRAWHYGYQNHPGLSDSKPAAAVRRYGARGTLRMIRREASARRGGTSPEDDASCEAFQIDEWCPMLRNSTCPSLATRTTPKAWPESALYPHGSGPKRMQASAWYDAETTANDLRAAIAGADMQRIAAQHSQMMSVLRQKASLEDPPRASSSLHSPTPSVSARPITAVGGQQGSQGKRACVAGGKRLDQKLGFLSGGMTYFMAPNESLQLGVKQALQERVLRQTQEDGLKWNLLKHILKVITGSQQRLPVKAVGDVAASFGAAVGTSALATKAQEESALSSLMGVFEIFAQARGERMRHRQRLERVRRQREEQRQKEKERELWKRRRRQERGMSSTAAEKSGRAEVPGVEMPAAPVVAGSGSSGGSGLRPGGIDVSEQEATEADQKPDDAANDGDWSKRGESDHVSLNDIPRIFTLVCSNEEECHAVVTTYRHQFRLELLLVLRKQQRSAPHPGQLPEPSIDPSADFPELDGKFPGTSPATNTSGTAGVELARMQRSPRSSMASAERERQVPTTPESRPGLGAASLRNDLYSASAGTRNGAMMVASNGDGTFGRRTRGVSAEQFGEALRRCPDMVEVFANNLAARLRYRHRPAWMAPILRAGGL